MKVKTMNINKFLVSILCFCLASNLYAEQEAQKCNSNTLTLKTALEKAITSYVSTKLYAMSGDETIDDLVLNGDHLAVTTNGTFGNQTFGISSGTSGCDPQGRITGGTGSMALAFLENNMEQFAMDASAGHGETIDTLAGILNVDSEKLGEISKTNFATLFPSDNVDAVDVTVNLLALI